MRKLILIILAIIALLIALTYFSVSETKDEFRTCEILNYNDLNTFNFRGFDSITVAANTLYEASFLKKVMQGEQYRDAWAEPITVPVAFLDTLRGGLKIIEEGGGKQTHSLELEDDRGIRYTLRSLSKDPEKLVPDIAKNLGLENIIIDGVSAQHPYAAIVVAKLSDHLNILHTHPQLMFVPKQETFGALNEKYGNRLYYFEYESEGKVDWTSIDNVKELVDTEDLIQLKKEDSSSVLIDHKSLIKARLFDLIIGDWDRHAKQWGWVLKEQEGELIAIPLPTDRDNAFFSLDGVVPSLFANDIARPKVQNFEEEIEFLPGLVREFDEYFLRSVSLEDFESEAGSLVEQLSDNKIDDSFTAWPQNINDIDGISIRKKLKSRRNNLMKNARKFYTILQERPPKNIVLSGSEELKLSGMLVKCFDCTTADYGSKAKDH